MHLEVEEYDPAFLALMSEVNQICDKARLQIWKAFSHAFNDYSYRHNPVIKLKTTNNLEKWTFQEQSLRIGKHMHSVLRMEHREKGTVGFIRLTSEPGFILKPFLLGYVPLERELDCYNCHVEHHQAWLFDHREVYLERARETAKDA